MPIFEYRGVDSSGKSVKGVVEGDSQRTARSKLKVRGIFPTDVRERRGESKDSKALTLSSGAVRLHSLMTMIRQLATLIRAHIPLDEALSAVTEQTDDPKLKGILSQVRTSVNEGRSLADSCKMFPKVFNPIFISMIRVGEASGNLDTVLERLAQFSESQYDLRNKVLGAMAYPAFMMVAGVGITVFLFAFAVPKITEVFQGSKMPLPTLTVIMIGISHFLANQWLVLAIFLLGLGFFSRWYVGTKGGREWWDGFSLRIPGFGRLKRMIAISRFSRTLSTLLASGVQLLDAIDIVKDVVDNAVLRKALIQSRASISEGQSIAGPLRASGQFPSMLIHMISVGEKTGELEQMLNVVADSYDGQVDNAIKSLTRLLEPLMIVIMGGVIALVALSIFLPMLQLNSLTSVPS